MPTLAAESEALWKFQFPGNTHALLTNLLNWSYTMQSLYNLCPDPKGFAYNAAFPRPVKPPAYHQLVSVGFYDTSTQPHQEIRFLGPGDAAEIVYGEVDIFRSSAELEEQRKHDSQVEAMKRALKIGYVGVQKGSHHMPMRHLAATGEGRWAYILVKGYQTMQEETPPHVMIAFHVSATTKVSTCLAYHLSR